MDAWVLVSLEQRGLVLHRHIGVLKSRGMPHSNRVYEFTMTEKGIQVPASDAAALGPVES